MTHFVSGSKSLGGLTWYDPIVERWLDRKLDELELNTALETSSRQGTANGSIAASEPS
jgi:hypothetical protein